MTDKDTILNKLRDEVDYDMGLITEGWEYYISRGISREEYAHTIALAAREYLDYWLREFEDTDEK
jgi:hypothetical protein